MERSKVPVNSQVKEPVKLVTATDLRVRWMNSKDPKPLGDKEEECHEHPHGEEILCNQEEVQCPKCILSHLGTIHNIIWE